MKIFYWPALKDDAPRNIDWNDVTRDVCHFERSELNVVAERKRSVMSVTDDTFQFSMGPYLAVALVGFLNHMNTISWMVGHARSELFWRVTSPLLGHLLQEPPPSVTTKGSLCGLDMYEPALQQPLRPCSLSSPTKALKFNHLSPQIVRSNNCAQLNITVIPPQAPPASGGASTMLDKSNLDTWRTERFKNMKYVKEKISVRTKLSNHFEKLSADCFKNEILTSWLNTEAWANIAYVFLTFDVSLLQRKQTQKGWGVATTAC